MGAEIQEVTCRLTASDAPLRARLRAISETVKARQFEQRMAETFAVLRHQGIRGMAQLRLVAAMTMRDLGWWALYARFVGPGEVNAECRRLLMRGLVDGMLALVLEEADMVNLEQGRRR